MRLLILSIFLVIYSNFIWSQSPENIDEIGPYQLAGFAKSAERLGDPYSAIEYYKKYLSYRPNKVKVIYKLAGLYKDTRNYTKAADLYQKCYSLNKKKYPVALFYCALMLEMKAEYDSALYYFENFCVENKNNKKLETWLYWANNAIEGCSQAKKMRQSYLKVDIRKLDSIINEAHIEFSPYLINDTTLIFGSLRPDTLKYYDIRKYNEIPVRQFYYAEKRDSSWIFKGKWDNEFNMDTIDTGNGILSPDKNRFYFTRCSKNWQNKTICHLYVSMKENGEWSKSKALYGGINLKNFTATQPTIGTTYDKTQEVLYFVSDRPGGYGGLDIWYSIYDLKNKRYKKPVNASGFINTPGDEITPNYHIPTKTMYFSSDFWPGTGGFDILKSKGEMVNWLPAKNIGFPINSSADDLYFQPDKDISEGFLVSNRTGSTALNKEICCDDIYSFKVDQNNQLIVKGTLYSDKSNLINKVLSIDQPLDANINQMDQFLNKAIVSLYMYYNNKKSLFFINSDTTDTKGNFSFKAEPDNDYKITVSDSRYIGKSVEFSTKNLAKSKVIEIKPIATNVIKTEETFTLKNIYYAFGKADLSGDAMAIIDSTIFRILNDFPDIQIEISSHTDNIGDDKYNLELSQKRAESVINYLTDKEINPARLVARGYGKSQPVAPNKTEDGKDNPEGREKNRRTEFKILGKLKP